MARFRRFLSILQNQWQKIADNTGLLSPDRNFKKFPLAIVEHAFYHNNTSYDWEKGKGGQKRNAGRYFRRINIFKQQKSSERAACGNRF